MKSKNVASGETGYTEQYDALVADAYGASQLLPHQQLGILALPTNPSNTQTWTLTINGTAVSGAFVTSIGAVAGNVLIGASAAATAANLLKLLQNPQTTTSTGVALSVPNQALIVYCGYALNGTSITIYSQNNSTYAPQTSFNASTTATGGSWTANTMALYIQPGVYYIGITKVIYAGGNTSTFTAPSSHPRIDIVTLDSSGTLAVTTGSENVSPTAPSYPANKLVICEVFHRVSETFIRDWDDGTQGYISNDVRPLFAPPYISDTSQVATQIFIPWITSPAQGDIMYYNGSSWVRLPAGTNGFVLQTLGASANPQWVLLAQTATVKDVSGANITPNADNAYHTIVTYSSIQSIAANQTLWIRCHVTNGDNHGSGNQAAKITLNGTDLAVQASSTNSGQSYYWDIFVVVPTPASSQKYSGTIFETTNGFSITNGSLAANLSSPFSITVQGLQNTSGSPAMNGPWTVVMFELNIIN